MRYSDNIKISRLEKSVEHRKGDLLLHRATSFDPTMGSSSGQRLNNN
jgi:hypothetical protein